MATRFELAHKAWPILTKAAAEGRILTYLDLARALGYKGGKVARFPLGPIQDFCLEKNLPPLTSIVVSKITGKPSSGFIAWEGNITDAHARVFAKNWSGIPIPFPPGTKLEQLKSPTVVSKQISSYEVPDSETVVNGRGPYQSLFRSQLMQLYSYQCALCDTRYKDLLRASHIVPWSLDSKNRLNPRNGILLCLTHDAAFEAGILRISKDLTVELVVKGAADLGKDLSHFLRNCTASKLRDPSGNNSPDPKFLEWRLNRGNM